MASLAALLFVGMLWELPACLWPPGSEVEPSHLGDFDNVWNVQIGLNWGEAAANQICLICLLSMHLPRVLLGIDRHCPDAKLGAGSEDPDCDLPWNSRALRAQGQDERLKVFRKAFGIRVEETQIGHSDCLTVFVYHWFQADEAAPSKSASEKTVRPGTLGGGAEAAPRNPSSQALLTSVGYHHLLDRLVFYPWGAQEGSRVTEEVLEGQEGHPALGTRQLQHLWAKRARSASAAHGPSVAALVAVPRCSCRGGCGVGVWGGRN